MKYRKKPVVIEATQWFKIGDHPAVGPNGETKGVIQTPEGPMTVTPGDWIITGVRASITHVSLTSLKRHMRRLLNDHTTRSRPAGAGGVGRV
jgi:hypothetical protein